ncbi:protein 60A-like [Cotesia typhae]|uniref:protein 60A-like n=1 Tax=Cotesia typhae TaxID=2053667 RepID=UPI003D695679
MARESSFIFSINYYDNSHGDNTVSSFVAKHPKKPFSKPDSLDNMWFDVKGDNNLLISAELHLYHKCLIKNNKNYNRKFDVLVYQIPRRNASDYVGSVEMPAKQNGWFTVNVTDCYKSWCKSPQTNEGLKVVAKDHESEYPEIRAEDIGVVGFEDDSQKHPFIVAYFRNAEHDVFEKVLFERMFE